MNKRIFIFVFISSLLFVACSSQTLIFTNESIASFEEIQLSVVEGEGPESGYTKPDAAGPMIRVAKSADRGKFESIFFTILNWKN